MEDAKRIDGMTQHSSRLGGPPSPTLPIPHCAIDSNALVGESTHQSGSVTVYYRVVLSCPYAVGRWWRCC